MTLIPTKKKQDVWVEIVDKLRHEILPDLQGGKDGEHFHLTAEELVKLKGITDEITNAINSVLHEKLPDLMGGNAEGHYHLSRSEHDKLINMPDTGVKGEKGDKGDPFTYEDFTEEQLAGLKGAKGDKGDKGDTGAQGIQGVKGDKGEPFRYEDFTVEQLNALKGEKGDKGDKGDKGEPGTSAAGLKGDKGDKGDPFTYADFTPEQLAALKGEKGDKGDKGDAGDSGGSNISVIDNLTSTSKSDALSANQGRILNEKITASNIRFEIKTFHSFSSVVSGNHSFTVPQGVTEIYISACGGGGGMTFIANDDDGVFVSGWNGAILLDGKVKVTQGDVFSITVGAGGTGPNIRAITQRGTRGEDTVIKKNDVQIIRLAGGNAGMDYYNAGNQTGQSTITSDVVNYPVDNLTLFSEAHYVHPTFSYANIAEQVKNALGNHNSQLSPFGVGGSLYRYGGDTSVKDGYGSPGVVVFKYIQNE